MTKKTETKEPELFGSGDIKATEATLRKAANRPPAKAKQTNGVVISTSGTDMTVGATDRPQTPPAPRSMLEAVMMAVRDPACDTDKMKALVDMQERIEERDAKKAFTAAFNALQAELPTITKDGLIDHGEGQTASGGRKMKARYSTYPNLMGVCRPLLKTHGFTFANVIEPSPDGTRTNIVGYLEHIAGHRMVSHFPMTPDLSGKKNAQQGVSSTASYGKRNNLILMLDIVSEAPQDQDNDGYRRRDDAQNAEPAAISKAQAEELRLAIEDAELPEEKFLEKYEIESLEQLGAKVFAEAKKDVAAFKRRAAEGKKHG